MTKYLPIVLIVCFLEGASVMGVELISAKLIAPWFGTSLYVWTSVLGVTMIALAGGYYLGGYLSKQLIHCTKIIVVTAVAACFVLLMPFSSRFVMGLTQFLDVRTGSLISSLVFLMPPLLAMGMISPLLIKYVSPDHTHSGKIAGFVFGVSTCGGVFSVLLTGFLLLPYWGVSRTAFLYGGLLTVATIVLIWLDRTYRRGMVQS